MRSIQSVPGHDEPQVVERDRPTTGPGQVLIQTVAAGANPIEAFIATEAGRGAVNGGQGLGLGWDVSGRVAEVGPGVSEYAVGDAVAGLDDDMVGADRALAEYVLLDTDAVAHVPDGLDLVDAASVPLNAPTAQQALDLIGAPAGRRLLVTGAAGAVGGYAVALAAAAGWDVTGLARPGDEEFVRSTGAAFTAEAEDAAYDVVLDGAVLQAGGLRYVKDGGTFVGVQPSQPVTPERDITVTAGSVKRAAAQLADLLRRSATGELAVRVAGTAPLEEAATVIAKVAAGGQRGRWLLIP
jgi:NADPH:quinone reductase-like Zn-dependent oxidoreductase